MSDNALALLESGARMLAEARSLDDLRHVRDVAVAAAQYARARDLGLEAVRYATAIAAKATRRIGELAPPAMTPDERARRRWDADSMLFGPPNSIDLPPPRLSEARLLAETLTDDEIDELVGRMDRPSLDRILRLARSRRVPEPVESRPEIGEIRHGDFREVLADIPDGSVALVLTDPPYAEEYLPLWDDLGAFAARVLRPGGSLVAYWSRYVDDVLDGSRPRKELHPWAQGDVEIEPIILALTDPGDLVVDPFAGSGTVGVAATRLGRRFIGAEVNG
jgi:hypothetical protein